jgi:hypothetical protein
MAIILSLPYALLMWSYVVSLLPGVTSAHVRELLSLDRMVIFSIALLLLCFTISNTSTRSFVTVMSALIAALILWCIRTAWASTEDHGVLRKSVAALRRTRGDVSKSVKELFQNVFRSFSIRRAPGDVHSTHSMTDRPFDHPVPVV